jgi:tungstate transport system ATP-binding protein
MSATPALVLQQVSWTVQGVNVLSHIDVVLHKGERLALIGANGSGKSSLLRVMHGLVKPTHGQRQLCSDCKQAMLFQRPHMLRASALHNVMLALWLQGTRWRDCRSLALAAMARVGLSDMAQRPANTLSGGQQQRLALARAWATQPDVLLLDEPTASLDPHAKREVEQLVTDWAAHHTLVFASHNLGQVKRLANRVIYMEHGRILADLPVDQFFNGEVLPRHHPEAHFFVQGEST